MISPIMSIPVVTAYFDDNQYPPSKFTPRVILLRVIPLPSSSNSLCNGSSYWGAAYPMAIESSTSPCLFSAASELLMRTSTSTHNKNILLFFIFSLFFQLLFTFTRKYLWDLPIDLHQLLQTCYNER